MRFGETSEERFKKQTEYEKAHIDPPWEKDFALWPVRMDSGIEVWLEYYLIRKRWCPRPKFGDYGWPGFWLTEKKVIN